MEIPIIILVLEGIPLQILYYYMKIYTLYIHKSIKINMNIFINTVYIYEQL